MTSRSETVQNETAPLIEWDEPTCMEFARIIARALARQHHAEEQRRSEERSCER